MIRFRLRELIADRTFKLGRPVTMLEISEATGISRRVLSSLVNERGYNTETSTLDKLCEYFGCGLDQLAEYTEGVPREGHKKSTGRSTKGKARKK